MTAIIPFTTWMARFTPEEYSLVRHKMRAIQWPGPDVQRKWDQATALNYIDLDAEIMPSFKDVLIQRSCPVARSRRCGVLDRRHQSNASGAGRGLARAARSARPARFGGYFGATRGDWPCWTCGTAR